MELVPIWPPLVIIRVGEVVHVAFRRWLVIRYISACSRYLFERVLVEIFVEGQRVPHPHDVLVLAARANQAEHTRGGTLDRHGSMAEKARAAEHTEVDER